MKATTVAGSTALALLVACAASISSTEVPRAGHDPAQITILYDAFGKDPAMQKDWGYAALVEYGGKRVLFDTGNNADVLERNAKAKHVICPSWTSWLCPIATAIIWEVCPTC